MMGVGKSSAGALLAARLGVPFVDSDRLIEQEAGQSIADLFHQQGEATFRAIERTFVTRQLADPTPRVVALGGGSLLDRSLRLQVIDTAILLTLEAPVTELQRRAAHHPGQRPLLAGDPDRLTTLLAQRHDAYTEAHALLDTSGRSVEQVADELLRLVHEADLAVALGTRSYPVRVSRGPSFWQRTLADLAPSSGLVVLDSEVDRLHGEHIASSLPPGRWSRTVLPPGEAAKNPATLASLWATLHDRAVDRRGMVLAIGGGVTTDLGGLAAATWLRGVRWVAMPTTLLGAVDAAVGGKTAIDLGTSKNMVGVVHQPAAVCIDLALLATEPARGFASGMAEVVKTALIGDASLFDLLERSFAGVAEGSDPRERLPAATLTEVIRRAVAVKARIVSRDEHEQGERRVLNLGHTLGHALEAHGGFDRWTHGEAVALGMVAALRIGESLGVTEPGLTSRVTALLAGLGLPHVLDPAEVAAALPWLQHDKKRDDTELRYVLVTRPGQPLIRSLPVAELASRLRELR